MYAIQCSSRIGVRAEILHNVHKTSLINLQKYGLRHNFYAYDPQLYICFKPIDNLSKTETILRVEMCLCEILIWMHTNMLKFNSDKTEMKIFASNKNEVSSQEIIINIGNADIKPSLIVRNLGAMLDSKMYMEQHINYVCRSCYGYTYSEIPDIRRNFM